MVRRHIDQMVGARNVRARNERIETGVLVESHRGKNVSVESERMLSVESKKDNVRKETHAVPL